MPATPQQLTSIVELCVEFAQEMLRKRGGFLPFRAQIKDRCPGMVAGHIADHPEKRQLYQFLLTRFREAVEAGSVEAIALAADVDIPGSYDPALPDGIRVLAETIDYSRFIYYPYRVSPRGFLNRIFGDRNQVEVADPFSVEIQPMIYQ